MISQREIKTKDQAKYPWVFTCDVLDCTWATAHKTREDAEERKADHDCPHKVVRSDILSETDEKGMPYTALHYGKSINEQLWDRLDELIIEIRESDTEPVREQGFASGIAWAISKMGQPYYPDVDAVLRQALRRYRMTEGTLEWEPTAGYNYNPPPPGSKVYQREVDKQPKMPVQPVISETDQHAMKSAFEAGFFAVPDLAKMYKVSEEQVKSIVGA